MGGTKFSGPAQRYPRVFWAYFGFVPVPKHGKTPAIDAALELRRLALLSSLSDARIGSKHDFSRPF